VKTIQQTPCASRKANGNKSKLFANWQKPKHQQCEQKNLSRLVWKLTADDIAAVGGREEFDTADS